MLENLKKEIEDTQKEINELEATLDSIEKEQKAYEERYLHKDAEWKERNQDIIRLKELLEQKHQELKNKQQEEDDEIKFQSAQRNSEKYQIEKSKKIKEITKNIEEKKQEIEKWKELINEANKTIEQVSNQDVDAVIQIIKTLKDRIITASQRINQLEEEIKLMQGALEYLEFHERLQSEELYDRLRKNALKENEKFDEEKNATTHEERNKALASRKAIELNNARWNANNINREYEKSLIKYKTYIRHEMSKILGIKYSETVEELDPNSVEYQLDDNEKERFLTLKEEIYRLENKRVDTPRDEYPISFKSTATKTPIDLDEEIDYLDEEDTKFDEFERIIPEKDDKERKIEYLDEEYTGPDEFERIIPAEDDKVRKIIDVKRDVPNQSQEKGKTIKRTSQSQNQKAVDWMEIIKDLSKKKPDPFEKIKTSGEKNEEEKEIDKKEIKGTNIDLNNTNTPEAKPLPKKDSKTTPEEIIIDLDDKTSEKKSRYEVKGVRKSAKNIKAKIIAGVSILVATVVLIGYATVFKNKNNSNQNTSGATSIPTIQITEQPIETEKPIETDEQNIEEQPSQPQQTDQDQQLSPEILTEIVEQDIAQYKAEDEYTALRGEGEGIRPENIKYWTDQFDGKNSPYKWVVEYVDGNPVYRIDEIQLETGESIPMGFVPIKNGDKMINDLKKAGVQGIEIIDASSKQGGRSK